MARQKEFNPEKALDCAMQVFWCRGYERTSLQDLVDAMSINRQSLYDTFGDKHRLYLAALQRYGNQNTTALCERLMQPPLGKAAIQAVFQDLVRESGADTKRRGCFMVNTAVELAASDPVVVAIVQANMTRAQEAFYQALVHAQANGEIAPHRDLRALAQFLMNNVNGLRVTAKAATDMSVLQQIVDITLAALN